MCIKWHRSDTRGEVVKFSDVCGCDGISRGIQRSQRPRDEPGITFDCCHSDDSYSGIVMARSRPGGGAVCHGHPSLSTLIPDKATELPSALLLLSARALSTVHLQSNDHEWVRNVIFKHGTTSRGRTMYADLKSHGFNCFWPISVKVLVAFSGYYTSKVWDTDLGNILVERAEAINRTFGGDKHIIYNKVYFARKFKVKPKNCGATLFTNIDCLQSICWKIQGRGILHQY